MKTQELIIEGMSCGHCVMSVKRELGKLQDVKVEDVQIGKAKVQVDESKVTPKALSHAIEEAGYRLISIH
ncbi:MAG: cation transporter [Bacteroidota bacterium]